MKSAKFVNNTGEEKQVMFRDGPTRIHWNGIKPGQECELPIKYGNDLGFSPVVIEIEDPKPEPEKPKEEVKAEEGKIGETKIETKKKKSRKKK